MAAPRKPTAHKAHTGPLMTYGCQTPGLSQFQYDLWAFALKAPLDYGAPTRIELFQRITDRLVPGWFEWHSWTERIIHALCEEQWVGFPGCHNSSKTRNVAGFACAWWLCAPEMSSVIFCSTTAKALRKRGWAEVQNFHTSIPGPRIGNFVDSQMQWQSIQGDSKHSISGIAVQEGDSKKVADGIKGWHTRRQMVVVDEATAVPAAIYDACTNLWAGPMEFVLVLIGNPRLRLDEFGKFCEPDGGWNSVDVDTQEWETKPQLNGRKGTVVRFDAECSPNITEGKLVSRFLPTKEKVEAARNKAGSANDPTYWSNERGFWAPEGVNRNVFTETILLANDAYGKHQFTGDRFLILGVLDPARTGDRPTLRYAAMDRIADGIWGIELMPPIVLVLDATQKRPIDYQMIDQVKRHSEAVMYRGHSYQCEAKHFGFDATGGGADMCDIAHQEWSEDIVRIGFGESASSDSCSFEDARPACEVYENRRCEMYYRAKSAVLSRQLKGVDVPTAKELTMIESDDSKQRIVLISKKIFRKKYGFSPDLADTAVMILEMARRLGFKLAALGRTKELLRYAPDAYTKSQAVFNEIDYSADEDLVEV